MRARTGLARRTVLGMPLVLGLPARAAPCARVTDLPLRLVDGYPLVSGMLAGNPVSLLLDTGAQGMLIEPAVARGLDLPLRGMTRIFGTGGSQDVPLVLVAGLRLGEAAVPAQVAPVAPLPVALRAVPPLAGLLGASVLSLFDLDLDVEGGRLSLLAPGGCLPFEAAVLPLEVTRTGEALVPVRVNGRPLRALVDTGSRATLLRLETAAALGLDAPVSANTAPGIDGARLPVGHLRVGFALGDGPAIDTPVSIAPVQIEGGDMLLGLDQLRRQRVWISYSTRQIGFGPRRPP